MHNTRHGRDSIGTRHVSMVMVRGRERREEHETKRWRRVLREKVQKRKR